MEDQTTEHLEQAEHAEHAADSGTPFIITVSVTVAILAVLAASISSLETMESGQSISEKNEAILAQARASDQFAFYQAKSLKKNMLEIAAESGAPNAEQYKKDVNRYEKEGEEILKEAGELEKERDNKLHSADSHETRHHTLTVGVTLEHVSIAIATIAIITKGQRWPWYIAIALGLVGIAIAAYAYL